MMSRSPIDSKSAGWRNEKLVLALLRKHGSLSQTQLCRLVGIGSSTASTIVGRLREKELIREHRGKSEQRGPKPIFLSLNPDCYSLFGIEINPSFAIIGLFDFIGHLTDKLQIPLGADHCPNHVVDVICRELWGLLEEKGLDSETVLGAGVTLSGSVSSDGVVHLSSPLGWRDVPLRQMLAGHLQFPVAVYSNHVRLLAEIAADPALDNQNLLYFNVANGVGSTIFRNGRLVTGATGRYGEIGHNVIDPNGPVCGCGHRGCLEAHISGPALAAKIEHDIENGTQSYFSKGLNGHCTPEKLLSLWPQAVARGDRYANQLKEYVADLISRSAADALNCYDPNVLILAGYVNLLFVDDFTRAIRKRAEEAVYDFDARSIDIRPAQTGEDALIAGICSAMLQDALEVTW